ncbi:MAG: PrsW family intramembrane metalloprotease [Anaerolineales bacterium]|nr:PrsW family intramembrane metalloprotease [Anaerolineales bacterium]
MQATASNAADASAIERSARNRSSFWQSSIWALVGLLVFVGIFNLLLPNMGANLNDAGLIVLGFLMSLTPALLWLVIFYRVDSREPEPKRLVATVFIVGMLLTVALFYPIGVLLFQLDTWLYESWWSLLLGGILVVGALSMGIVYLTVRFVLAGNPEFDERIDGILYAVAAGLGIATIANFMYVLQHGGVDLGIGSIRMVTTTLGFASFSGVLGYFIGQARFERTPAYYLPLGVAISATLVGIYEFVLDQTGGGFGDSAWRDLLVAIFFTLVILGFLAWLIQRSNEETLRVSQLNAAGDAWEPLAAATAQDENSEQPAGGAA